MSRVSVIVTAYNAEQYIAESIESVLLQSVPPGEVIVVDDGSMDNTPQILRKFSERISILTQENRGQTEAMNRAISAAHGEFIAFHDADDLWAKQKLEWQLSTFQEEPELGAVFGMMKQFISPEILADRRLTVQPAKEIAVGEMRTCMLIRRSEFDRIGTFDSVYRGGTSFFEWLGRAKRLGLQSKVLKHIVVYRRLHLGNYGRTNTEERDEETMKALRSVILQQRKKSSWRPSD